MRHALVGVLVFCVLGVVVTLFRGPADSTSKGGVAPAPTPVASQDGRADPSADVHVSPPALDPESVRRRVGIDGLCIRVVDHDGTPVDGASVIADRETWTTDAEGLVAVSTRPAELRVMHDGHAPWARGVTPQDVHDSVITVQLGPASELDCTVLDVSGQPIADVHVELVHGSVTHRSGDQPAADLIALGDGSVVYRRRGATDRDGRCRFVGLAPGLHSVVADRPGFVAANVDGEWTRRTRAVMLTAGANGVTLNLQQILVQVIAIENRTNLPRQLFESMLFVAGSYPSGLTDIAPDMAAIGDRERAAVIERFGKNHFLYVGMARAKGVVEADLASEVHIGFFPDKEWNGEATWAPAADLQPSDVVTAAFDGQYPLGTLRVVAPFALRAHPISDDGPAFFSFGFAPLPSAGQSCELPAGRYLLRPGSEDLLSTDHRHVEVTVEADAEALVDLSGTPTFAELDLRVADAMGAPDGECVVRVAGDVGYRSIRPPDGHVRLRCEPGEYSVSVTSSAQTLIWQRQVTLVSGRVHEFAIAAPR